MTSPDTRRDFQTCLRPLLPFKTSATSFALVTCRRPVVPSLSSCLDCNYNELRDITWTLSMFAECTWASAFFFAAVLSLVGCRKSKRNRNAFSPTSSKPKLSESSVLEPKPSDKGSMKKKTAKKSRDFSFEDYEVAEVDSGMKAVGSVKKRPGSVVKEVKPDEGNYICLGDLAASKAGAQQKRPLAHGPGRRRERFRDCPENAIRDPTTVDEDSTVQDGTTPFRTVEDLKTNQTMDDRNYEPLGTMSAALRSPPKQPMFRVPAKDKTEEDQSSYQKQQKVSDTQLSQAADKSNSQYL
ncbi:hypothetical protein L596_024570 [Steinernema carpocapsae]|uniref:Uncharacterized protein n=2 Tax=Steinernema carpocapsae TaxID=34508 RepID=A0A4U5MH32_STECR|nr:hypothetical protein L596_024570 [Steinernema carpocapsae]